MQRKTEQKGNINNHLHRFKSTWQVIFLPVALVFGATLLSAFNTPLETPEYLIPYLKNIDLSSYMIAIIITLVIFNLKRMYFSARFSRKTTDQQLKKNPQMPMEKLLAKIFNILYGKMMLVWILGAVLILEGIIYYWVTGISYNMNIYAIIGIYSLMINYPRKELFEDIPWYVASEKKLMESDD